jgi:hypothetical protein
MNPHRHRPDRWHVQIRFPGPGRWATIGFHETRLHAEAKLDAAIAELEQLGRPPFDSRVRLEYAESA